MPADGPMLTFECLICPQPTLGSLQVRLWATRHEIREQHYATGVVDWPEYASRIEQSGLLEEEVLRSITEAVRRSHFSKHLLHCRPEDLATFDFRETEQLPPVCLSSGLLSSQYTPLSEHTIDPAPKSLTVPRRRLALLGVRIDDLSMDETIEAVDDFIERGGFHQIATANVDFLTKALSDPELRQVLHGCDLVLADGMPLVWSSRLLGVPLRQRVTGADLIPRLLILSEQKKRRLFFLGARDDRSRTAIANAQRDYPGAIICGRLSPPLAPLDRMDNEAILREIEAAKPDVLLVAFGNPKQEMWIAMHRKRLQVPVCIGVGASIDFLSGEQSRAPLWMQRAGLEWVHRLASEPRRLALRYVENALFLIPHLSKQVLATSLQPRDSRESGVSFLRSDHSVTATVVGNFSGATVDAFVDGVKACTGECSLILDLTSSTSIAPDAAGAILHLAYERARAGRELWVVSEKPFQRKAIRAAFPAGEPFRTALTLQDALRLVTAQQFKSR